MWTLGKTAKAKGEGGVFARSVRGKSRKLNISVKKAPKIKSSPRRNLPRRTTGTIPNRKLQPGSEIAMVMGIAMTSCLLLLFAG